MQAVGRLGSYISRGVYSVSAPFHPFGGAVDIVLVEQPDGGFKSSPWYVKFGKFQGVLKRKEKVVTINVNGVEASFHMYLDHKGEAFFLRDDDDAEAAESLLYPSSSGDESDLQDNKRPMKSMSFNFDSNGTSSMPQDDGINNRNTLSRTISDGSRVNGFVSGHNRVGSVECAEIAANLLDVKWSTNLASQKPPRKDSGRTRKISAQRKLCVPRGLDENEGVEKTMVISMGNDTAEEASIERQLSGDISDVSIMRGYGNSGEEISTSGVQTPAFSETSECLIGGMDRSSDQAQKVTKNEEVTRNADPVMPVMEVSPGSQQINCSHPGASELNIADFEDQTALSKPETLDLDLRLSSSEKVDSNYVVSSTSASSVKSVGDCVLTKSTTISPSVSYEEEQFIFSDLDEYQYAGSISPEDVEKEEQLAYLVGLEKASQITGRNYSSLLSSENSATENQTTNLEKLTAASSSPTAIPKQKNAGENVWQHTKSLPGSMQHDIFYPLSHSLDSKSQILNGPFPGNDGQLLSEEPGAKDIHSSGEFKGDSSDPSSSGGNWRLWPFSFRRTKSEKVQPPAPDANDTNISNSSVNPDTDKNQVDPGLLKKNVRATTPTSEQLVSLNLKEGKNIVTFTFSTSMLGKQEVDAQIYLWKWNDRIVISDVDGTITRSDVLGQFMPLVGVDWSQTGVAHLFSAIKENGYQLLFLSARAISQAYLTRQFLGNLKQDGKVLPDGPVVISPDGLFPSLFREVIRRAPHEFKIACLEDIKALFPSDCNPFYAGFGNRDTDEISYLKVGIPKGKIFIINPKGEVVVNRCHDTKSYASLHALVNGMFPPTNSSEQEDFNSWNFWKLPPPGVDH